MNSNYCFILCATLACAVTAASCSSEFTSCNDTRTCPNGGGGGQAGNAGQAGDMSNAAGAGGGHSDAGGAAGEESSGTAGIGGAGGAATESAGDGGMAGADTCTNTTSDASNCGSCGHSCLGGACADGICQPLLLGTVPSSVDFARGTVVSDDTVYVFTQVGRGAPSNVWQTSAKLPATPTEVTTNGTVSCIMNGTLFWTQFNADPQPDNINSCTLSNCATTTKPVVTVTGDFFEIGPGCDATSNELVWVESSSSGSDHTIYRADRSELASRHFARVPERRC
jgi:hypothetical protein